MNSATIYFFISTPANLISDSQLRTELSQKRPHKNNLIKCSLRAPFNGLTNLLKVRPRVFHNDITLIYFKLRLLIFGGLTKTSQALFSLNNFSFKFKSWFIYLFIHNTSVAIFTEKLHTEIKINLKVKKYLVKQLTKLI
ncbi:hypothetical protein PHYBLDRAFT_59941 [Phycomyces blakesleeanus NRRL 1555(-)]|uniref:Uncharacterized protein n=1 Tax=Phycomyces blakesleeanus (strain ATCC 8743b / DSM 1359 / FGSC 10004 / NBRC 33097 / NRRL 1555) TaxID=763407 RepID=A0A162Q1Q9_PHYB8|nr:hypothetical protein PHYBLDRAFT_59941 [Phycomyces blakesleeanus NRRL 1555(-)]OAD76406.1 hypothetical protein PHYBLDRAFT_59941 [Phycomyces blakesleeanus NRRL 1555(-)]|eukprot:XP_018294446.1 hypothetical protein PHYBLDRAFT_59941 [Phycomyces blakesleeanus NRRL 1555(-)]